MLFQVFLLIFLFIFIYDRLVMNRRTEELMQNYKGYPRMPIIGTNYVIFLPVIDFDDLLESLVRFLNKYKDKNQFSLVSAWMNYDPEIWTDDYRIISTAVQSQKFITKGSAFDALRESLGDGILFSTHQKWFTRRRIITPTFHFKILEQFFEVFKRHNKELMEKIDEKAGKGFFNFKPLINNSLIDSLCETAMGIEAISCSDYMNAVPKLLDASVKGMFHPMKLIKVLYYFSNIRKEIQENSKIMRDFTTKIINKRREELMNIKQADENEDEDFGIKKKTCLLDVLLTSTINNEPLSNSDISEEVDNFMFAGQDTTTNAISFALYLLAKHPEKQQKLYNEIEETIGENELTFSELGKFKYLDLVIKETLRLFPSVPILSRRIEEEVEIDGHIFPAKTVFQMMIFNMFKNPQYFEKPNEFIPERFLNEEKLKFAFIPFSAGQRNCIGQKFAMNNMKNHIINIIRKYKVSCGEDPKVTMAFTIKCDCVNLSFDKRVEA